MSAACMPRPARRSRCTSAEHSISQTSSQRAASPPSTSLMASMTTKGSPSRRACPSRSSTRRRTPGWTMASRSCRAAGSANTRAPSAARSSTPEGSKTSSPKRARTAPRTGSPGAVTARASTSASMTQPPSSPSMPATVDLPQPMGPVSPITMGPSPGAVSVPLVSCSSVIAVLAPPASATHLQPG